MQVLDITLNLQGLSSSSDSTVITPDPSGEEVVVAVGVDGVLIDLLDLPNTNSYGRIITPNDYEELKEKRLNLSKGSNLTQAKDLDVPVKEDECKRPSEAKEDVANDNMSASKEGTLFLDEVAQIKQDASKPEVALNDTNYAITTANEERN